MSEISVISLLDFVGAICISESKLTSDICDAEISIPNFDVFREDRASNVRGGGSAIFVRKQFKAEKMNWFVGTESLALKLHLPSMILYVICMYRSPSHRTIEENQKLLSQLANVPAECENNVIVVGDINLPKVDWKHGIVSKPENSNDKWLNMQSEFLDLFIAKGFSWYIEEEKTGLKM